MTTTTATPTADSVTRAVEALLGDADLRDRFRVDPQGALAPYALSPAELEAVKAGDAESLASVGADVARIAAAVDAPVGRRVRFTAWVGTGLAASLLAAFAVVGMGGASPGRRVRARRYHQVRARHMAPVPGAQDTVRSVSDVPFNLLGGSY